MNGLEVNFVMNDQIKIVVVSEELLEDMNLFSRASIFLYYLGKKHLLSDGFLHENLYVLKALLIKALNNELQLHSSIQKDIGYLLNQEWQFLPDPGLFYTTLEGRDYWIGNDYLVCNNDIATWIYNDARDGSIIMHVTPLYPGLFSDWDIPYEKWIANYKPLFSITIPRDVAQKWVGQAQEIVETIDWNSTHWETRKEKRA